jgi:hypothetical protein
VTGPKGLEQEVLHLYFNHSNYSSFTRQMNYFGFRKLSGGSKMAPCVFQHAKTTQDLSSLLSIKRRKTSQAMKARKAKEEQARAKQTLTRSQSTIEDSCYSDQTDRDIKFVSLENSFLNPNFQQQQILNAGNNAVPLSGMGCTINNQVEEVAFPGQSSMLDLGISAVNQVSTRLIQPAPNNTMSQSCHPSVQKPFPMFNLNSSNQNVEPVLNMHSSFGSDSTAVLQELPSNLSGTANSSLGSMFLSNGASGMCHSTLSNNAMHSSFMDEMNMMMNSSTNKHVAPNGCFGMFDCVSAQFSNCEDANGAILCQQASNNQPVQAAFSGMDSSSYANLMAEEQHNAHVNAMTSMSNESFIFDAFQKWMQNRS